MNFKQMVAIAKWSAEYSSFVADILLVGILSDSESKQPVGVAQALPHRRGRDTRRLLSTSRLP